MKNLLTFLMAVFLIAALPTLADVTGKISGVVTDQNNDPLPGVNVMVLGTNRGAATDARGFYFILNVPSGSFTLQATMIGYQSVSKMNVRVVADLTTRVDFKLNETTLEMPELVVEEYRVPAVQKDLTFKIQATSAGEIRNLPVNSITQMVQRQAGITRDIPTTPVSSRPVFGQFATIPTDELHFRGGRSNETLYLFDGINVNDAIWGGFDLGTIGEFSLESMETLSGTFGPNYGEAMSGVIHLSTKDNVLKSYNAYFKAYTDELGQKSWSHNTKNIEFQLGGPVVKLKNMSLFVAGKEYSTDGYLYGYIYPNYVDSNGADRSGSPEKVPLQYTDHRFLMGKWIWQPHSSIKLAVGGFTTKSGKGLYNHYFKYNPYGTPFVNLDDQLVYAKVIQFLNQRSFYSLTLARYDRQFTSRVYDNPEDYAVIPQNGTAEFSISGEDWVYFDSDFRRNEIKLDLTSQVTNMHKIDLGGSVNWLHTRLERRNPDGFDYIENYNLHPRKYAAYLSDKMEFEDIGMILVLGLRWDYIDPNREFVMDITDPEGEIGQVTARHYLSPRLGISYPISDRAAFHFGYGQYNQFPDFYKVYQGLNAGYVRYPRPNVKSVSGAIAIGDIEEERTVNYEAGVQTRLTDFLSLNCTGFYRKTSNLVGTRIIEDINGRKFPAFDNLNFATVKGVEITLRKNFQNYFSGALNYTYSKTLVSSSLLFLVPQDLSRTFPADWDQPHVVSGHLAFEFPQKWGFTLFGSAGSGLPYTFNQFEPNAERAPWLGDLDLLLYKDFNYFGLQQRIFLQILNLPNRRNIWWVYADSGKPDMDANPATTNDYTRNPSMWGPGRRVQLGCSIRY